MNKGFTLIELMIVIAIIGIFVAILYPVVTETPMVDHTCKAGYKFTRGGTQIIGANGGGIPCDNVSTPQAPNQIGSIK